MGISLVIVASPNAPIILLCRHILWDPERPLDIIYSMTIVVVFRNLQIDW